MYQVRCGFSRLSVKDALTHASNVISKLEDNSNFPALPVSIESLKHTMNTLAKEEMQVIARNYTRTVSRNQAHEKLKRDMAAVSYYVNAVSNGDLTKLQSSGFGLRKARTKASAPEKIQKVTCKNSVKPGSVRVAWTGISSRDYYVVRYTYDLNDENSWVFAGVATGLSFDLENLQSGKKVYVSVCAVNNAGQSDWSNAASLMVA